MKKYLFIVLLVGVWSCEDTKKDENDTLNPIINFKNLNVFLVMLFLFFIK